MGRLMITSMGKGGCELLSELIVVYLFPCNIAEIVVNGLGGKPYGEVQGGTVETSCNFGDDLGFWDDLSK